MCLQHRRRSLKSAIHLHNGTNLVTLSIHRTRFRINRQVANLGFAVARLNTSRLDASSDTFQAKPLGDRLHKKFGRAVHGQACKHLASWKKYTICKCRLFSRAGKSLFYLHQKIYSQYGQTRGPTCQAAQRQCRAEHLCN